MTLLQLKFTDWLHGSLQVFQNVIDY